MAQSQISASVSGTSSRSRHTRDHDVVNSSSTGSTRYVVGDSEWETKEALRQKELEDARARAAQMEKTMRWWSDCTANWREKWSKVRNERNKARDEAKILRNKLEIAVKDANAFKHENQELEIQNEQLREELQQIQAVAIVATDADVRMAFGQVGRSDGYDRIEQNEMVSTGTPRSHKDNRTKRSLGDDATAIVDHRNTSANRNIEEYILQGAVPKHAVELYKDGSPAVSLENDLSNIVDDSKNCSFAPTAPDLLVQSPVANLDRELAKIIDKSNDGQDKTDKRQSSIATENDEFLVHKMTMLSVRLEQANRTIFAEREEKSSLHQGMEKLRAETLELRERCDELQRSRNEAMREFMDLRERCKTGLSAAQADLIDEASNREEMDQRLSELRTELERLQAENAAEWGKCERLETEKISLERENKKLKNEVQELQERVDARRGRPPSASHADSQQLRQELNDRNKDLLDLKHSHAKLKKMLSEKTTEMSHALRRSEQYESEVKRVRWRVDELKRELSGAQDEVDAATYSVRRLQRVNEHLVEQLESANVQIEHFKNSSDNCILEIGAETNDDRWLDDDDNDESPVDYVCHRV